MSEFRAESRVRDVVAIGNAGIRLLWEHGYEVGEGYVDNLSQYESLDQLACRGRIRDLPGLLAELNTRKGGMERIQQQKR